MKADLIARLALYLLQRRVKDLFDQGGLAAAADAADDA